MQTNKLLCFGGVIIGGLQFKKLVLKNAYADADLARRSVKREEGKG